MVAAIALWFHLRLPSCGHRFESQAHHLCFFKFVLLKLYRENNENKQKEAGIGPFFLKKDLTFYVTIIHDVATICGGQYYLLSVFVFY